MMKKNTNLFVCPNSNELLFLELTEPYDDADIGYYVSENKTAKYPVKNHVARFVPSKNYSESFGLQWNLFRRTQLDSFSGINASADRFWSATGWSKDELRGKLVLDVGCGAGRFAEIALSAGAKVVAIDYSGSVDACYSNLGHDKNLTVVQADLYNLPFRDKTFDFIYSLGVLQHTPDVEKAFFSLQKLLKKEGKFCVDFYCKSWKSALHPKYWLRPITKRLPKLFILSAVRVLVPILYPISSFLGKMFFGYYLKKLWPIADPIYFYERQYGKTKLLKSDRIEWSILDTFDWLTPAFDNPQTERTISNWMKKSKFSEYEVVHAGHLVARGTK